jgi:hypothetical protein
MGISAIGLEGSPAVREFAACSQAHLLTIDLRKPLPPIFGRFGLAMSIEVAEHLEREYANVFVENLCALSSQILVSCAPPGQRGVGHVNLKEKEYWVALFSQVGYSRDSIIEHKLQTKLLNWRHKSGIKAIYHNAMVFIKETHNELASSK